MLEHSRGIWIGYTHVFSRHVLQRDTTFVIFCLLPLKVKSLQNGTSSHGKIRFKKKLIPTENENGTVVSPESAPINLPYFFDYKTDFFLPKQSKNLNPSYNTDLDICYCLGSVKLVLKQNLIGHLVICSHSRERETPSYSRRNTV